MLRCMAMLVLLIACDGGARQEACPGGVCPCPAGLEDCDGEVDNGCETDLALSAEHCGACGRTCANGSCQAGVCSCLPLFGDCDGDRANGCETSLAQEPAHCGRCDRDCSGGGCADGMCQPVVMTALSDARDLAVGDGRAFWIDAAGLSMVVLEGGTPELLAADAGAACTSHHDGRVYYLTAGALRSVAPGEQPLSLAGAAGASAVRPCLVARGGSVYWIDLQGDLRRVPASGGSSSLIAQDVHALTADDEHHYWGQLDTVFQARHDGSPAGPIAFESAAQLATHFGDIYWLVFEGAIRKRSADPGPIDTVVESVSSLPSAVAVDESGIYAVLPAEGTIVRYRHQDGGVEVLAAAPARSIALDARHLYWLSDTALMRVAK